ncbi:site-specific integrase [Colwellia sp. BRX10-4]|jgi:integrase|uniref:tyrosine-type recombinase/integrase n=1 Tax=Colwellia sp. BRX10-4 TaxID=2759843 RepID=UPI0015F51F0A|nr:site-specific integrase [Colwellia sp. BRX10-4]MBA6398241.1 site-specific integrase [Colwellia sp. BRX10-4]
MAAIKQLKSGNWNVEIRIKGSKTICKTFKLKLDAEQFSIKNEQVIRANLKGQTLLGLQFVLDTYRKRVLINHDGSLRGSYHHTGYLGKSLVKFFGDVTLSSITSANVASFREKRLRNDGMSESTTRKEMELLQRLYKFADIELDIEVKNPVNKVKKPSGAKIREKVINNEQLEHILDEVPHKYHAYFRLLMETACRRSELLYLKTSWVDLSKRVIHLPAEITKTGTAREVPLSKKAIEIIEPLLNIGRKELFRWKGESMTQCFVRAAKRLGYKDVVIHTLRHSCLSHYGRLGFSVFQLRAISGHRSVRMLERYVKVDSLSVLGAMDRS